MSDAHRSDAETRAAEDKVRDEWQRLEQKRLEDERAEAREDIGTADEGGPRPHWLVWLAFALALAAGIAVTVWVNTSLVGPVR